MSGGRELFNNAAKQYDETFTNSHIGRKQRDRVYFWLERIQFFNRIKSVFEINCGTGFDAQHFSQKGLKVTATDASSGMINFAKENRSSEITFFQMAFDEIDQIETVSEAIFSNFGGLNCISENELKRFSDKVAAKQRKGDLLIWVIMPRHCFMESIFFFLKFKWGSMFRRNTSKAVPVNVDGVEVDTYYHSPRSVKKILKSNYEIRLIKPVALFLPPSYLESFFAKRLRLLNFLNWLEQTFGRLSMFSGGADHYIIIAERK